MVHPSLSKLERERIAQAVQLAKAGPVKWRNIGRRLSFVTSDGKEHLVLTSGSDESHAALVRQAKELVEASSHMGRL